MNKLRFKLKTHLFLHKYIKKINDNELEILLQNIKNKESFESSSRDDILKLLIKTSIKNPTLVFNAIKFMF